MNQSSEEQCSIPSEASSSSQTRDDLNYTQPSDATELVEALRAPSFEQDSQWHDPKAVYATKPRALLDAAADFITQLQARATAAEALLRDASCLFAHGVGAMTENGDKANQERNIAEAKRILAAISSHQDEQG